MYPFTRQVEDVKTPKSEISALVLDYLTLGGYPKAAAQFSAEANLTPQENPDDICVRQQIQHSIHRGDIEKAIDKLNAFDPEILDKDNRLHFSLLRLQLVELIRKCTDSNDGDIQPALDFATDQLGSRASQDSQFLEELEQTMALIVFPRDKLEPDLAALLKPNLRQDVADMVNKKILDRHHQRSETAVRRLIKLRAFSEDKVRSQNKHSLPNIIDLGLPGVDLELPNAEESGEFSGQANSGNVEPMEP